MAINGSYCSTRTSLVYFKHQEIGGGMPDTSVASAYSIPFHGVLYMASRQEGWEAKLEIWGCKRSLLVIYTAVCMLGSGIQPSNMQHEYSPSS